MIDIDELERINNAGDRYGHITPGVVAELIAEVRRLQEAMKLQANAARMGMDAAKTGGAIMLELATQARAESSPDVLASERTMNAMLTEEVERLTADRDHWKANHDNQVSRARFLIERGDIPVERVRAYEEMEALREDAERWNWFKANYGAMSIHENFAADLPNIFALGLKGRSWDEIAVALDAARKEKA